MAGHSKWSNIKNKKAKADVAKGKIFTKLAKAITLAAREGGGDPASNFRLRIAIENAREFNMPNDNIDRAIKRGTGQLTGVTYEELIYEGYGPGGVAIMLDVITDNKNRTAGEVRHIFSRHGGNLGETGCVAWLFERKGYLTVKRDNGIDEEELMMHAIEGGAEDFVASEEVFEIITSFKDFETVKEYLESQEIKLDTADITMLPDNTILVDGEDAEKLIKLVDALEDNDDIQEVYANYEIPDELMESLSQ